MSGIFQADAVLKTAIELGIADLRANPWLIDYMLEDYTRNPYLQDKYGLKQVDACKEWFLNNNIDIYIGYHGDKMRPPCVSILLGSQSEKEEMKHMGDASTMSVILLPNKIGKPIPYIVKPFLPVNYDNRTGIVTVDTSVDLSNVEPGQILVNPANGTGYTILDVLSNAITIEPRQDWTGSQLGILPHYQYYKANVEHTFLQANYTILCTAHGDPQNVLWLHDIVMYCLLRYRESLLEANGLAESVISGGDLARNTEISLEGAEYAWDRPINLTGQIEQTFIKAPRRFIETISTKRKFNKKCNTYKGGIRILSNLDTPDIIDESNESWTTDGDDSNDEDTD